MEQGSQEWFEARRCKVSGTRLDEVMGSPNARGQLIAKLISEEGTEQVKMMNTTPDMERGSGEEAFAIKMFEQKTGKKVDKVGLCSSDEYDFLVLSPDGLIKNGGKYTEAVEVKSPNSHTAIYYKMCNMIEEKELGLTPAKRPFIGVPADYKWQVVNYFLVNPDLEKLYFIVYDVRFIDEGAKMYVVEVERSNELLQDALKDVRQSLTHFREDWLRFKEVVLPTQF